MDANIHSTFLFSHSFSQFKNQNVMNLRNKYSGSRYLQLKYEVEKCAGMDLNDFNDIQKINDN